MRALMSHVNITNVMSHAAIMDLTSVQTSKSHKLNVCVAMAYRLRDATKRQLNVCVTNSMCVLQWHTDYGMHASMSHVNSTNLMSHVNMTNLTRDLTSQSHELNVCVAMDYTLWGATKRQLIDE